MRFKKGSKVEVWSTKEMPVGSWQCAEVTRGDGHTYTVQYCSYGSACGEATMERVSGKAIRPCPPALQMLHMWGPGDIVEVFENFSWKMAIVLKVLGRSNFLVRLLGSPREFGVGNAHIRARQLWKDGRWIVIRQISAIADDRRGDLCQNSMRNQSPSHTIQIANVQMKASIRDGCIPIKKRRVFEESHDTLKTELPYDCSRVESPAGASKKCRAIDKEGRCYPVSATRSTPVERVDSAAFQRETFGENTVCAHSKKEAAVLSKVVECRMKPSGDVGCPYPLQSRFDDADRVTCSVGSCTVASESSSNFSADPFDDVNSYANEMELTRWQNKEQVLKAEIHRLELHAYRCTLEALYALGPLSWEQEALISNLRLSLHISDDEHLMELRNLVFSDSIIPLGGQSCCRDSMRTHSFNNTRFPLNGSRQSGDCIDASCAFSRAKEQRTEYVITKLSKVVSPSTTSLFLKQRNAKVIRWVSLQKMVAFFNLKPASPGKLTCIRCPVRSFKVLLDSFHFSSYACRFC